MTNPSPLWFDMLPWLVACVALIIAVCAWEPKSHKRCAGCVDRDHTIDDLQAALDDARLHMLRRRHTAADMRSWGEPARARRPAREPWVRWPGHQSGRLPVAYGTEPLDAGRVTQDPPPEQDLRWLTEPDVWQISPPPSVEMVRHEWLLAQVGLVPTREQPAVRTWQVPALRIEEHAHAS